MYPNDIIFGVGLYEICIIIGLVLAMLVFRICADKRGLSAKFQNMVLVGIPVALFVGYPSAVFVQWIYNGIQAGDFSSPVFAASTGSTFYGGFIGGVLAFLIYYFIAGHFLVKNGEHVARFSVIFDLAPCCITVGHALGRLGCFFAGCCHGMPTDSPLGVYMDHLSHKVLPTQLFECLFLLVFFAFLMLRYFDGQHHTMAIYLIGYGVWRFMLEFLRGDDRGETFISFLTPSQLTAILMIAVGILLIVLRKYVYGTKSAPAPTAESDEGADE